MSQAICVPLCGKVSFLIYHFFIYMYIANSTTINNKHGLTFHWSVKFPNIQDYKSAITTLAPWLDFQKSFLGTVDIVLNT